MALIQAFRTLLCRFLVLELPCIQPYSCMTCSAISYKTVPTPPRVASRITCTSFVTDKCPARFPKVVRSHFVTSASIPKSSLQKNGASMSSDISTDNHRHLVCHKSRSLNTFLNLTDTCCCNKYAINLSLPATFNHLQQSLHRLPLLFFPLRLQLLRVFPLEIPSITKAQERYSGFAPYRTNHSPYRKCLIFRYFLPEILTEIR